MAKPTLPRAGERYSAKEVLEILHSGQYTFAYGDDDSDDGNESDELSLKKWRWARKITRIYSTISKVKDTTKEKDEDFT